MKVYNGIVVTDEVNLYNEKFTLQAMYSAYLKQWNELIPSFANHDHTKSIGYSKITGIFIEPCIAYTTNSTSICENSREEEQTREYNYNYLYRMHVEDNIENYNLLIAKTKEHILGTCIKYWINGVFIYNKGIVTRAIPKFAGNIHDGLIDIQLLKPVLPGVYKVDEYLVFAHRYFRRGYSYLNTLNSPFLSIIEKLGSENRKVKVAIDLDCIGLAGTEHREYEYQYWWGPKFNNDLNNIPLGVTVHQNEHYNEVYSEIQRTEFGWYIQDDKHTFECEEITGIPNLNDNESYFYACRFTHSMINSKNTPDHLDGAIRAYSEEKMIERLDITIKESERDTIYTKLWRVDGDIPVEMWKELITHYYKDNELVGEYFGGYDEKVISRSIKREQSKAEPTTSIRSYIPCNINHGDGLRINLSFLMLREISTLYDVYIRPNSYVLVNGELCKFVESEAFSLYKQLKREGLKVRYPNVKQVDFFDTVYNYPVFECVNTGFADIIIKSISLLCHKWSVNCDDRIISFTIDVPYADRIGRFSFLGHVDDFVRYFDAGFTNIPLSEDIFEWLSKSYDFISNHFNQTRATQPFDILKSSGILSVQRCFVPQQVIKTISGNGEATLLLPEESIDFMSQNNISAVIASIDAQKTCSKCSKNYQDCNCVSFLDDDVFEIIQRATPIGLTWTNRSVFNK